MKIKEDIAKIISSSGDIKGATMEELQKIIQLVDLFQYYAYSLLPDKMPTTITVNLKHCTIQDLKRILADLLRNEGWNLCREEMLEKIKEIYY